MEITTTTTDQTPRQKAAVHALAVVGFIVLILIGIALAVYAARYVPVALNRLGLASVSVSSVFTPSEGEGEPALEVIAPDTEIPFEPIATSTEVTVTETPQAPAQSPSAAPAGTAQPAWSGTPRATTVPVYVPAAAPHGKADLAVEITAVGYCSKNNASSFRSAREVPDGENGGFRFAVRNLGTNVSGTWDFAYELPTSPSLERTVSNQRSLKPGDRMDFTLCFTEPRSGDNRDVSIRVDSGRDVNELNENNNADSADIDIES